MNNNLNQKNEFNDTDANNSFQNNMNNQNVMQQQINDMNNQVNNNSQFNGANNQVNNNSQFNDMNNQVLGNNMTNFGGPFNNSNNGINKLLQNKKLLFIIIGVVLAAVLIILYFTVFQKDDYESYDKYLEDKEKQQEKINKNFSIKDYKIQEGVLVEITNKNNLTVDADIKVEFYDASGNIINVQDTSIFGISPKGISYGAVRLYDDLNYSTYKVTAKLDKSPFDKSYIDKIEVVSSNAQGEDYIIQIKNNSDVKLSNVQIGILFLGTNDSIIDFETVYFEDLNPGETTSGDVMIPFDENYDTISYQKAEVKVISAE